MTASALGRIFSVFMYFFYSCLLTLVVACGLPFFVYRELKTRKRGPWLRERLGLLPPSFNREAVPSIWVHAVSVGEVVAARSLLPLLRESFPREPVFFSVTTMMGRQVADRQLREADGVFYSPFDWAWVVRRVVRKLRPRLLLLVETEIWPNLIRTSHEAGAVTMLVNGRISDRSYSRYRIIRLFMRRFLGHVDCFCMQNSRYAERIMAMGAEPHRVNITGSLKFDAEVPDHGRPSAATRWIPINRPVLVAGSTLAPEEEILLEVFGQLREEYPELFLVLAARHPRRFDEVTELASAGKWKVVRRTKLERPAPDADVMILDTIGELASVYVRADIVFVGGSLAPWGGHNLVEPAIVGKPVVFGPHMSNFKEMSEMFLEADAAVQVADRYQLRDVLTELLRDAPRRRSLGQRAQDLVQVNRGAGRRTVEIAREMLKGARWAVPSS